MESNQTLCPSGKLGCFHIGVTLLFILGYVFPFAPETTWDTGKTTSYVEKIISDIIQTISDLFSPTLNSLGNSCL